MLQGGFQPARCYNNAGSPCSQRHLSEEIRFEIFISHLICWLQPVLSQSDRVMEKHLEDKIKGVLKGGTHSKRPHLSS